MGMRSFLEDKSIKEKLKEMRENVVLFWDKGGCKYLRGKLDLKKEEKRGSLAGMKSEFR